MVDSFARADSSNLGSTETGQPWTSWSASARVVSQQAELYGGYSLAVVDTGLTSGTAAVTVAMTSPEFWLVVRASDGSNYWRFGRWQGGSYLLQQVVNNNLGSPALQQLATVNPAAGDRLSCQIGSTLTCSVNGTGVVRTSDPFNAAARHAGLAGYTGSGGSPVRFDDVLVEAPATAPNLRVTVTAGSASATTGAPVSWSATVTNAGSGTAPAATATVTPPAGLSGTAVSTSAGTCSASGAGWTCALGDRAAGTTATITVNGTAPSQPAQLTLTVSAASSVADADPADNSGSATVTTSTPPPVGGASASDTFTRADSSSLGSAETGQLWTVPSGAARVVSQQAEATATAYTLATVDAATATGTASVRVATISAEYWLVVRAGSSSSYWRFGRWQSGGYQLQQVNNNALGSPALTPLGTVAPAAGDVLSCSMGTTLTCSVNGNAVVRTTDAFNASATSAGFAAAGSGAPTRFDDFVVVPPAGPDLRVSVTGPGTVDAGAPASWTGTVSNSGAAAATGSVVTVTPPSGLAAPQVSTSAGACSNAAGTWTCSTGMRPAGSSFTVSVSGSAPTQAGTMTVTISASAQEADVDPSNNSAGFTTTVRAPVVAPASVQDRFNRPNAGSLGTAETGQTWLKWSGTARISAQQAETSGNRFSLAALDSGTATGTAAVTVTAPSPEFWLVFRAGDAGNYWRFGRWQGGAYQLQQVVRKNQGNPARTLSATVMPAAGDRLSCRLASTITCSVNGTTVVSTSDGFNANSRYVGLAGGANTPTRFDDFSVAASVSGAPDLQVTLAAAASTVQTGSPVSWTATVANGGTASATATVVTVTPPAALTGTAVSWSAGSCARLTTTWQCSVGTRAPGSSLTVTVTGTAPTSPTGLTTTVAASAQETDTDPASNTASSTVDVRAPVVTTAPVSDSFDRADSASLGTADTGQAWSNVAGSFGISAGTAAPLGSGTNQALLDPGFAHGTYQVTVKAGAAPNAFAVVIRGRDAANSVRIGPDSSGFYRLWKVVNGSVQPFAVSLRRGDVAPRDGDVIRIVDRPDDGVFVSVNGRHLLDAGDPVLLGERRFGLLASSSAVRFDSVSISSVMSSGVITTDTFTTDGPLADRWTETGTHYGWHANSGWVVSGGRVTNDGYGLAWVDTTSEVADARVQIRSPGAEAFLVFRYGENADWFRFGHHAGRNYAFERVSGGTSSTVVVQTAVVPQAVDSVEVRQFLDGRVEGHVNGVLVASFTDSTFSRRSTAYGIEGNAAVFDDFGATAK